MRLPFILALAILASAHAADTPPQVTVSDIRRVFHNGEHNAFTDLCRFRDRLYLTFRSCPDGHAVNPTASIIILQSADDGATWAPVHRFSVQHRDTRDPHFLVFRDRLFVYTGTWWSGATTLPREDYDLNQHLGYAAWSDTALLGTQWIITRSTDLLTFTEIFRFDGTAYTFNSTQVAVVDNGTAITVIDRLPPPGKGFYRFEALAP